MNSINFKRHRRLRSSGTMRDLVRETTLTVDDLIYPLFVHEGKEIKKEVPSMPGVYQLSLDYLDEEIEIIKLLNIKAILLFGIPQYKDQHATSAYDENGIVQQAIKKIKSIDKNLLVITDTCICHYQSEGHCGIPQNGKILNDFSLEIHAKVALSQVKAGADVVAPSSMMDGFVSVIRNTLDENGYHDIPIMSYGVKYASSFYGPFRDAANSSPQFGDRRTYQMDPANRLEAFREAKADIEEGADFLIIKPGISYLDILRDMRNTFPVPLIAYQVSGEYSMIKAAAEKEWINEQEVVLESMLSMKRAGADMMVTYYAKDIATWLSRHDHDNKRK
ncbi:porphobilinogen synthase [Halalkalibacter lacteus]|uniref:porphobilinogen synthase n=1 Tax=Halalkalibacter lacteus TaxID=3090663 RepID=UPI002FC6BF60